MNLLVDTHAWLWWRASPDKLGRRARAAMEDDANTLWFSAASAWEITTKHAIGKLPLPVPAATFVADLLDISGAKTMAINVDHAVRAGELPLHHRDPFDRLLVAQAQIEKLVLVTDDDNIAAYNVKTLWR
jgi:PIN domain nuclease of toxin-antitoxin system